MKLTRIPAAVWIAAAAACIGLDVLNAVADEEGTLEEFKAVTDSRGPARRDDMDDTVGDLSAARGETIG